MSKTDQLWQYVERPTLVDRCAEWQNQCPISYVIDFDRCDLAVLAANVIQSARVSTLRSRG
jgi:hypothetical protein